MKKRNIRNGTLPVKTAVYLASTCSNLSKLYRAQAAVDVSILYPPKLTHRRTMPFILQVISNYLMHSRALREPNSWVIHSRLRACWIQQLVASYDANCNLANQATLIQQGQQCRLSTALRAIFMAARI
ncbi:hypothetical protein TWF102_011318 [Orbilia oligospora]|uniref:Uncharacterized protein n=1 Tax=Orbilia oligospora TaxID=2813651 RepID=A0A7C8J0D0_ORBOL|nr:hypothetical protein TWF102_011318 [Orbilia oligospora]